MRLSFIVQTILTIFFGFVVIVGVFTTSFQTTFPSPTEKIAATSVSVTNQARHLIERRNEHNRNVWALEELAQQFESEIVELWDALRANDHDHRLLAKIGLRQIRLGTASETKEYDHGIQVITFTSVASPLSAAQWDKWLDDLHAQGYRLQESEWHHTRFDVINTSSARSVVEVRLHVINETRLEYLTVRGPLIIQWETPTDAIRPSPVSVDASGLKILRRVGRPAYRRTASFSSKQKAKNSFVAVYDLNRDGTPEIIFNDTIYARNDDQTHTAQQLRKYPRGLLSSAVIADFTQDGRADLICASTGRKPDLYIGDAEGKFSNRPSRITSAFKIEGYSTSITVGDVNGDTRLDVWLTQYKEPYHHGQMPSPFYDANDGYPSCLLINRGQGLFENCTNQSGLAKKRFRRTYSSSFYDADNDRDLDLFVVNDFSGVDVYENDGTGTFSDVTDSWIDQRHTFGMGHTFGDFNQDGRLDIFVTGMSSTTVRRLDAMGLTRPDRPDISQMRTIMGFGNRMYLAQDNGYQAPPFADDVARTGWSWGTSALDFDNDGDQDIFVANGHVSGKSARDYCSDYWRHDIYYDTPKPDPALELAFNQLRSKVQYDWSWNGYEHNHLLMNQTGKNFIDVAFLLGVSHEFDSRSVIADDINKDGRVDLLVVVRAKHGSELQLWRNELESRGNWIGVALIEQPSRSSMGAKIMVRTPDRTYQKQIVSGDSYNAQHSNHIHFGLGNEENVNQIIVQWSDGTIQSIEDPSVNRYYSIPAVN